MPGKIFVNYRRDDDPNGAARVRDGLAAKFGKASIFMDVDDLLAGQRFDQELAKALEQCDVLIAIIGTRWMELLKARAATGERDYVREEIAGALRRKLIVIPVRIGREGQLPTLPRHDELPEDIRDLVLHQKHDVAHERFGRDMAELNEAITVVRGRWCLPAMSRTLVGSLPLAAVLGGLAWMALGTYEEARVRSAAEAVVVTLPDLSGIELQVGARGSSISIKGLVRSPLVGQELRSRLRRELPGVELRDQLVVLPASGDVTALQGDAERLRVAAADAKRKAEEEATRRVLQPGQSFRDCNDGCPEMVVVPAGSFVMGSPENEPGRNSDEGPQRTVTIRQPFAVGKFEATFEEWEACVAGSGCTSNRSPADQGWGKGRRPVINVSWGDAKQYVTWLSRKTGHTYRLLTEAEWEYAARAGTTTIYSWGSSESELCGFANGVDLTAKEKNPTWIIVANCRDGYVNTAPVGSFKPNGFGLHDMHGNVWEWVEDCYAHSYSDASTDGSATKEVAFCSRVIRGGSWDFLPKFLRAAGRVRATTDEGFNFLGFRVARALH